MSHAQSSPMTSEEFLAWEAGQAFKWEFDGFQPVAMAGGSDAHAAIQVNLLAALAPRLRGTPGRARGSDLKVLAGASYRYPDAFVTRTPVAPNATVAAEPVVIFEILSASTIETDKTVKLAEYLALPSVRRYVMIEQSRVFATVVARTSTGWDLTLAGPGDRLSMPEIGVGIAMVELYDGVAVAAAPQAADPVPSESPRSEA